MKLTKAQCKEVDALREQLLDAIIAYNAALQALNEFRAQVVDDIETFINDKSEKWQEGDAGQAHQAWRDAWEESCGDELDDTVPEYPEAPDT